MRRGIFLAGVFGGALACCGSLSADEPSEATAGDESDAVMIDVTTRDRPSAEEWDALHEDGQRGAMLGGLADFKSKTIAYMNTRYFTANPAEGTLASYGKMGADKRYDRFGHIEGVEFSAEHNSWTQHFVVDGKALLQLTGSRLMEFAGIGVEGVMDKTRQFDVTFVGTTVPKDEAIRRLNANIEALEYFDALAQKRATYKKPKLALFGSGDDAPAVPKVVLANVVMVNGTFSNAMDASVDGKLSNRVTGDGVQLKVTKKDGEELTLLSPIVRCYRTYSVDFKTDPSGQPMRVRIRDLAGNEHLVPQVFDLTPDL